MQTPHIAIHHTTRFPRSTFDEFEQLISASNLQLRVEEREEDGPFAGIEWLLPTAVIVYIGKSYFDGFLKEMGKDHYSLLKSAFKTVYAKLLGPDSPKVAVLSTQGKVCESQPYSLIYSVLAEAGPNIRFKLLLQNGASQSEYESTIASFLELVSSYHADTLEPQMLESLLKTRVVGATILLAYNPINRRIEPIDPMPKAPKK